ncbi:MAG: hypothetical protein HXX09_04610 [Bacteroidetes bacterium]|nr:hypothetical protein [Bacteroidota bacterium]
MKKKVYNIVLFCLIGSITLFFTSCYYDNMEDLYVNRNSTDNSCDSVNVTFTGNISVKFANNNCFNCHGNAGPNLNFQDYTTFKDYIIIPANKTKLFDSISIGHHSALYSGCELSQLSNWINLGTPQ